MTTDNNAIAELQDEIEGLREQLSQAQDISRKRHVTLTKYRDQNEVLFLALEVAIEQTNDTLRQLQQAMSQFRQIGDK